MYSQANVGASKSCGSLSERCPSLIVDTASVLREADGPVESDSTKSLLRVERCSPQGASRKPAEAGAEPEEHKRQV